MYENESEKRTPGKQVSLPRKYKCFERIKSSLNYGLGLYKKRPRSDMYLHRARIEQARLIKCYYAIHREIYAK